MYHLAGHYTRTTERDRSGNAVKSSRGNSAWVAMVEKALLCFAVSSISKRTCSSSSGSGVETDEGKEDPLLLVRLWQKSGELLQWYYYLF